MNNAPREDLKICALLSLKIPGLTTELLTQQDTEHPKDGPLKLLNQLLSSRSARKEASEELSRLQKLGIGVLPIGDPLYPQPLSAIHNPPLVLFYRGENISLLTQKLCLAVVGSRKADEHACRFARELSQDLASSNTLIVSGLAFGIDAAAHSGAVDAGVEGSTVAVLGNGLEHGIYPSSNEFLARRILDQGGLILSQFPTTTKPFPQNFLDRNRVIAGLSKGTVIIQAAKRSGALATARHALEEGRDVFSLPGPFYDERYAGSNELLKNGAYLITGAGDLAQHYPELSLNPPEQEQAPALTALQKELLLRLSEEPSLHVDELLPRNCPMSEYAVALMELEARGLLVRGIGGIVSKT